MRFQVNAVDTDTCRGLGVWVRMGAVVWCAGVAPVVSPAIARQRVDSSQRGAETPPGVTRRGHPLLAVQHLEYRPAGADARVRFEWDQVRGAREYRLVGHWTSTISWTVRMREHAVTTVNAASWTPRRVTYETSLPPGNHSWRLMAVFGPNDVRVVGDSTPVSFAVR